MKFSTLLSVLAFSSIAGAQQVDVKGVDTAGEGTTTIEIKKGAKETLDKPKWETQEGQADLEGEAGATNKDAKAEWKKVCNDWKKEMRADNRENKILNLNCGTVNCGGDAGSKVCTSTATYKLRTKVE